MTTTHKWIAGAVGIAVVLFAGSWFLLVGPKRGEAADVQSQADGQLSTNQTLQTSLELLKQQKRQLPQQQAKLAALRTQIPQTPSMPSLVQLLDEASKKAGVDLISLTPAAAVPVLSGGGVPAADNGVLPPDQLAMINAGIVVEGGYFEVEKFVNALENLDRYVLVANMTIVKKQATDTGTTASGQQQDNLLTASLASRVYLLPTAPAVTTTLPTTTVPTTTVPTTGAAPAATPSQ